MVGSVYCWSLVYLSVETGFLVHEGSLRNVSFHDGTFLVTYLHDGIFSVSCRFNW